MIEMPEATTIAKQMREILVGKTITRFTRGNMTHKFLWLNRPDEELEAIFPCLVATDARSYGRSIYLLLGDYLLWWGDTGGKLRYHPVGEKLPPKYHLIWTFSDGSSLTFVMSMWGSVKLIGRTDFNNIPNDETGIPPLHPDFTFERFDEMLETYPEKTSKGIKGFLVATGYVTPEHINGLGNAIIQDILFIAKISPKRKVFDISRHERQVLYDAIQDTISKAIDLGGRYDEIDLFGNKGRYVRLMDSKTAGTPCRDCGSEIQKISYLGGACYLCTNCQF